MSKTVYRDVIDGREISYRLVSVTLLSTDGYQRAQSPTAVRRMTAGFDIRLFDLPLVAKMPDSTFQILDGGHRYSCWQDLHNAGRLPIEMLCRVVEVASSEDAADLFIKVNQQRRSLVPYDYWRAACIRRDQYALDLKTVTGDFSMPIDNRKRFKSGTTLTCVANLKRIWESTGNDALLRDTLRVLTEAWPEAKYGGDGYRAHGFLIEGMAEAILEVQTDPSRKWDPKSAIRKLSQHTPSDVRAEALNRAAGVTKATNNPDVYLWVIRNVFLTGKLR